MRSLLTRESAKQAILAMAATTIPNVFHFAYHVAMTRQLGVELYGALSSLLSLLIISSIPAGILATVIAKFVAEFHAVGDRAKLRALTNRIFGVAAAGGAFAIALSFVVSAPVASYLHIHDQLSVILMGVVLGLGVALPALRSILQGVQNYVQFAVSSTIEALGKAFLAVWFVSMGYGLAGAVAAIVVADVIALAYTALAVLGEVGRESVVFHVDLRRLAVSAAGVAMSTLCLTVLGYADQPMVKHFLPAHEAGLYGAASLAGKIVLYGLSFVPLLILPKAAARAARGESLPVLLLTAMGFEALAAIPILCVLAIVPGAVLTALSGKLYLEASPLLLPYGASMAFLAASGALAMFNIGSHRFSFLIPLALAGAGLVVAIQIFHRDASQVLMALLAANALGFIGASVASLTRSSIRRPIPVATEVA